MEIEYVECSCGGPEHTLRFVWDKEWEEIYVDVFLSNMSFLKRLWYGIKYIFGYKSKYGPFEESNLGYKEVNKLKDLCNRYLDSHPES